LSIFEELKRRNVFRVSIAYVVSAWLLAQVADLVIENIGSPDWVMKTLLLVLALGFPVVVFFSWAFEVTPEGVKRESEIDRSHSITHVTGRKLDRATTVVLAVALGYFIWESRFAGEPSDQGLQPPAPLATEQQASVESLAGTDTPDTKQAPAVDEKSIAVLPFAHRSPNPDDQYFTDGMHDDLLTLLAKQDVFKVISRTSVMEYRDTIKNLRQIGEELSVRHILEGGVQRAGARVRINVQLIDAQTDEHLWAEIYDREMTTDNLFDIQTEISEAIAQALHVTLSGQAITAQQDAPTKSLAAYELYLRGKQLGVQNSEAEWQAASGMYLEALALDPEFAEAFVALAEAYITLYWSYGGHSHFRRLSREAIDRAIALNPELPEIQMAEGFYHYWGLLDYDAALVYLDRAIEMMPNNAEAHMWRGWTLRRAGRWNEALVSMQRSLKLDPRQGFNWLEYGQTLSYIHDFPAALEAIGEAKKLNPGDLWPRGYTTSVYLQLGDVISAMQQSEETLRSHDQEIRATMWEPYLLARNFEDALLFAQSWLPKFEVHRYRYSLSETLSATAYRLAGRLNAAGETAGRALQRLQTQTETFPPDYRVHAARATAYAAAGDRENTLISVDLALSESPLDAVQNMQDHYLLARALVLVGETSRALELLEPLLPGPSHISVKYVELDPHWDSLRDDRNFQALLDRYRDGDIKK
jgi:TolB-like protein/lipoprotein NlpI